VNAIFEEQELSETTGDIEADWKTRRMRIARTRAGYEAAMSG
jgi:hypothetical protein